jgi:hypothetical protein
LGEPIALVAIPHTTIVQNVTLLRSCATCCNNCHTGAKQPLSANAQPQMNSNSRLHATMNYTLHPSKPLPLVLPCMCNTSCCTADELPALRPGTPDYEFSRKAKRSSLLQSLEQQYGPHFSDSDVRLYRKQRELNAARQRPSRRGGFPLDDSLPRPDTFLKLSMEFQRVVCG